MTTTLEELHRDPAIVDRAIARREQLDIVSNGIVAATLVPTTGLTVDEARKVMKERFANPDWDFAVGTPLTREERNSRG
jgi:hypothetical protein